MSDDNVRDLLAGYELMAPDLRTIEECERMQARLAALRSGAEAIGRIVAERHGELLRAAAGVKA